MDELRTRALRAAREAEEQKTRDAGAAEKAEVRDLLMGADHACQREFGIKADWTIRKGIASTRIEGVWVFYQSGNLSHNLATLGDAIREGIACGDCEYYAKNADYGIPWHGHRIPLSIHLRSLNRRFWRGFWNVFSL